MLSVGRLASRPARRVLSQLVALQRPCDGGAAISRVDRPVSAALASAVCQRPNSSSLNIRRRSFSSATDKATATTASAQAAQTTQASNSQQTQSSQKDQSSSRSSSSEDSGDSGSSSGGDSGPPYPPPTLLVRMLSTLALLPIVYLFHDSVAGLSTVRGTSMQPTLNPHAVLGHPEASPGDVVVVWKWGKNRFRYQRGQVVVALSPSNPRAQTCKRLIALEGDWVRHPHEAHAWTTVPRGRVWIEGDNERTSIEDSRQLGPIPMGLLCGRVTHVVWPPSRWGRVQTTLEPAGGSVRVRTAEQMREHSIHAF